MTRSLRSISQMSVSASSSSMRPPGVARADCSTGTSCREQKEGEAVRGGVDQLESHSGRDSRRA